ncbi:MAG: hypothetical protein SOZ73_03250 [Campylobacter sp.]|nr:hypothetical protein [Campylobacter sp.]MDY3776226.1 hypothetical protein [Campylobacter sp.]
MTDRYARSRWLFGDDFSKLQATKVLVWAVVAWVVLLLKRFLAFRLDKYSSQIL